MEKYNNKQEAEKKAIEINKEKGFKIASAYFFSESIYKLYNLPSKGWYVKNAETKYIY